MIRIFKHPVIPESLLRRVAWNGEDVVGQLMSDQQGKCYLCERKCITDFQIEHFHSRSHNDRLTFEWRNLFCSCGYCNGKKSSSFDNILNPLEHNVEEIIRQNFDFPNSKVIFSHTGENTEEKQSTISLLDRIFNGSGRFRTVREQNQYDYAKSKITSFQSLVLSWLTSRSDDKRKAIVEELAITAEFLGFKYWIIQSNDQLLAEFGDYIKWNKHQAL